jgi:glycosyltransferase involved in cell wall biosynthesis
VRIAILGTRGIPAAYGGFETLAQELAAELAGRGHEVTVYCRPRRTGNGAVPEGVHLVTLPCIHHKYLETVTHTALSALHATARRYDAVLVCNAANAVFAWLPRLRGTRVALNVDGLEANRAKWNRLGRAYYRLSERVALRTPNRIVTDARVIARYYQQRYGSDSTYIPYGAHLPPLPPPPPSPDGPIARFALRPKGYVLYVSRLEPENHAHTVAAAFSECQDLALELVITGQAPYAAPYIRKVLMAADSRTVFTGGVYGDGYHELQAHARCYVHATVVGGVHPALVEAMAHGRAIICADTPENRETLAGAGVYYQPDDHLACAAAIRQVCLDDGLSTELGARARERARNEYSWTSVGDAYERLLLDMHPDPEVSTTLPVASSQGAPR